MKQKKSLSAFSIIIIILFLLAIITHLPLGVANNDSLKVVPAKISNVFMAPFEGFKDSIDIGIFVLLLGGFLGIVSKTNALNSGILALVNKLKGREILLIPILMILFSIGGSTYGMAEETIAFYILICSTMVIAGFDTMVATAIILIGTGVGVLGSTLNPFANGVAIDTIKSVGITDVSSAKVIFIGITLWVTSLIASIIYVINYAKKVKKDKGHIILSLKEQEDMQIHFKNRETNDLEFTKSQKITLILFMLSFVIMILSLIAWPEYGINIFDGWSSFLTGSSLGQWYFGEIAMWFMLMGVIIAIVNKFSEKETVDAFIQGASEILSVVLIIAISRGVSVLMKQTYLDTYILNYASNILYNVPAIIFVPSSYILYMILAFFIPSTSALATVSMPIMGPLTYKLNHSPEVMIMIFTAASGLINLITPTSGVVMGGLSMSKIEYSTYFKWVLKLLLMLIILNILVLTIFMILL